MQKQEPWGLSLDGIMDAWRTTDELTTDELYERDSAARLPMVDGNDILTDADESDGDQLDLFGVQP